MKASLVIRSRDEAPRLRLVLASLESQRYHEILVVDDGSADEATADVVNAAGYPIRYIRHAQAQGRSAAANAGAQAATGDVLIFLDGDTLAAPGMIDAHRAFHAERPNAMGRGETWHLRGTRFLRDPETGAFWDDQAYRAAALPPKELDRMRVTIAQVRGDFGSILARAAPGIYPGTGPRRLHDAEMAALCDQTGSSRLWAAASGSNFSMPRAAFLSAGGFNPALDINEHRDLALRLCRAGLAMGHVANARTIHMTHRAGWRDPLQERGWEAHFPDAPIAELRAFWQSLGGSGEAVDFFGR